jgi:predicted transcriptional regulator
MEKYVTRLAAVDTLIKRKATGTPKDLAMKLDVSESTIFRILKLMKETMNLSIEWSAEHTSYVYRPDSEKFSLDKLILSAHE